MVSPNGTVSNTYDSADRCTQYTMTGTGSWTYSYDSGNRVTSVVNPYSETTSATYNAVDQPTLVTAGNSSYTTYAYDTLNRPTDVWHRTSGGTTLGRYQYAYDGAGNVTQRTDSDGSTTTFGYDAANQLAAEARTGTGAYTIGYTYDSNGNRLTKTLNGTTDTYTYDSHDKLLTAGAKSYGYDNNGNCISVTANNLTTGLTYDYENRVTQITYSGGSTNTFQYNGLGLRTRKVDSAGTFNYACDGTSPASPVLSDGAAVYTSGVSERRSGTSKFYHGDLLGSTRGITNASQTATDSILYDAFGMTMSRSGSTATPFGFAGSSQYQTDSDSGLMLLGHRYYDSSAGRFISQDPIKAGDNWYAYCENNPIRSVDPLGLFDDPFDDSTWGPDHDGNCRSDIQAGDHPGIDAVKDCTEFWGRCVPGYGLYEGIGGHDMWGREVSPIDRVIGIVGDVAILLPHIPLPSIIKEGPCFVAGTPVQMADGSTKAIENIKEGDLVLSRDADGGKDGKVVVSKVKRTFVHDTAAMLTLSFDNGDVIETTENHPFFVDGKGFVPAGRLAIGNAIVTRAGPEAKLTKVERQKTSKRVYNFEVEGTHSYFVGNKSNGLWVHNNCLPKDFGGGIREAVITDGEVSVVGPRLKPGEAIDVVKDGRSVFVGDPGVAKDIGEGASTGGRPIRDGAHGGYGYYPHYHPFPYINGNPHIWFPSK